MSVTILSGLLLAAGVFGLVDHLTGFRTRDPFPYDLLFVCFLCVLAIIAGVYLLLGRNWARWLALAWIAFHVIVSAFNSVFQLAVHAVMCAVFAYFLFRPRADRYFRAAGS